MDPFTDDDGRPLPTSEELFTALDPDDLRRATEALARLLLAGARHRAALNRRPDDTAQPRKEHAS